MLAAQQPAGDAKVNAILNQLPASGSQQELALFKELISVGDASLLQLAQSIQPNGKADGIKVRYAISLLTHTATTAEEKKKIESAYLSALAKAQDVEVKAYLITNLKLVGSNASVPGLKGYLADKDLYDFAATTLVTIGGDESRQALLAALKDQTPAIQVKLIKTLGKLQYLPALESISKFATSDDINVKKQALWSLAWLADASSVNLLLQQAKAAGFKNDPAEATVAMIEYLHQQSLKGNGDIVKQVSNAIIEGTPDATQQHFRLAALSNLAKIDPDGSAKLLIKELAKFDSEYQKEILKIGQASANTPANQKLWLKEYKKASGRKQADILAMLSTGNSDEHFINETLIPALGSKEADTRIAATSALASKRNAKHAEPVLNYLLQSKDDGDLQAAETALLQLADKTTLATIAQKLEGAQPKNKIALLKILASRRATDYFSVVYGLTNAADASVKAAALKALPFVSSSKDVPVLLKSLPAANDSATLASVQSALMESVDKNSASAVNDAYNANKIKLLPVLPYLNDQGALKKVMAVLKDGNAEEKQVAFDALKNWKNEEAIRPLLAIRKDAAYSKFHGAALESFIAQLARSSWPDDQKLLLLREVMPLAADKKEKIAVLRAAGNVRTFLSLIFVSGYLDDAELSSAASRSAMQIALPTSDAKPGMTGMEVRNILQRMLDKLTGQDSQYERIDILTYLEKLPHTEGYTSIFNGKDLSGWQGLVDNPLLRAKMTKDVLAKKQKEADAKIKNNWSVKDGMIVFQGDGANLCTTRPYGDFEMIVDWKISKNGDSGIYLRGSPQVQIWDTSRVDAGAQVGSGGLYNNKKERSTPLVVADNPIGEWNTFNIKMVGDKVTVLLNGVLVVDNVVMENYWDRNLPIFPEEAIELQAHGTELAFRNIYVKELNPKPYALTKEETEQGFALLFNGKDLDQWVGNKTDYVVEDNTIAIYPGKESHGNLYTAKEYGDFIFRFEFQLTPGANNGLGIHAPLEGDAAYVGKEIQILDNTSPQYSTLQVWQYHGSVYGVMPARREFLKPIGEWNQEEVYVKGDNIKVTLNGTVIVEGDLKKATKNGTLDHKDHPGLNRHTGHIGFLGHGSVLKFKNIRIKEISK